MNILHHWPAFVVILAFSIEDDDIFKFNCNDIGHEDTVSLLLAITDEDI